MYNKLYHLLNGHAETLCRTWFVVQHMAVDIIMR